MIHNRVFQVGGDPSLADAFGNGISPGTELTLGVIGIQCGTHRICQSNLNLRILFLEKSPGAGQGSTGPHRTDEGIDFSLGLLPDFRACGFVMCLPVGHIVELVCPDGTLRIVLIEFLSESSGNLNIVLRIPIRHGGDFLEFGPAETEHVLFFLTLGFGNDDQGPVTTGISHQCQSNSCISSGPFDNQPSWFENSLLLRVQNDCLCSTVLDRTPGVHEFCLPQNRTTCLLRSPPETDQRRIADRLNQVFTNAGRIHFAVRFKRQVEAGLLLKASIAGRNILKLLQEPSRTMPN